MGSLPYTTTPPPGIGATGKPAFTQASQPPVSATAFFQPAFLSSSATRALVASSSQAQKATSQASLGNCRRSASKEARSGSTRTVPGAIWPLMSRDRAVRTSRTITS